MKRTYVAIKAIAAAAAFVFACAAQAATQMVGGVEWTYEIADGEGSYLITRVTGPGTLTFWWKVSCEAGGNDALRFLLDGSQKYSISGERDWAKVTVDVAGSGSHVLKWNYTKNGSVSKGQDFGWIDQIQWTAK